MGQEDSSEINRNRVQGKLTPREGGTREEPRLRVTTTTQWLGQTSWQKVCRGLRIQSRVISTPSPSEQPGRHRRMVPIFSRAP